MRASHCGSLFCSSSFHQLAVLYRVVLSSCTRTNRNKNSGDVAGGSRAGWVYSAEPAWKCVALDSVDVSDRAVFYAAGYQAPGLVWVELICRAAVLLRIIRGVASQLSWAAGLRDVHE